MTTEISAGLKLALEIALLSLDPKVDDHWTKDGLPRMDHLEAVVGTKEIDRGHVTAITGDLERCDDWGVKLKAKLPPRPASTEPDLKAEHKEGEGPSDEVKAEETAGSGLGVSTITRRMPPASDRARGVTPGQVVLHQGKDIAPVLLTVTAVGDNGEIDAKAEITGETIAGLRHKSVVDQTPADDPARLQPFWDFAG